MQSTRSKDSVTHCSNGLGRRRKADDRKFSDVTDATVQAGSRTILQSEKFHVRVIQTAKADFVEEYGIASAGALIEKLAEENARPARNKHEADRVILAVIGKKSTQVCVKCTT
jgi:hypothetical protein